jgi:hypothetical protein
VGSIHGGFRYRNGRYQADEQKPGPIVAAGDRLPAARFSARRRVSVMPRYAWKRGAKNRDQKFL